MKRPATVLTILALLAAFALALPAEAAGKKKISPNDSACNGTLEICRALCDTTHMNDEGVDAINA